MLALARLQGGVLSREQVTAHGFTRHSIERLVRQQQWCVLDRGIYSTRPDDGDWHASAWAGVLIGGDRSRLGGLAAAYLHGLLDVAPEAILVLVPEQTRRQNRPPWVFRRERASVRNPRSIGGPQRTVIEDTVLDLCDGVDGNDRTAAHWVTTAIQRRLTTASRLRSALCGRTQCRQRRLLHDLVADVDGGAESVLEVRYLKDVERAHRLPRGQRQSPRPTAHFERGSRAFRDMYYPAYGLVVELDGRAGHLDAGRLRDLRRDNVSTLRGDATLRYGWQDVADEPCLTAFQVAAMLAKCGWTGIPARCARCRGVPDAILAEVSAG
jgi:hypothetical protein